MPPKSKAGAGFSKKGAAGKKQKEIVQDERFQAVVLTDSFETRFMPLTSTTPRCLLPLANVPLIEYTLEFLAKAEVNEVFLMCTSHADQILEYIEKSKWAYKTSPFKITCIFSLESRSIGDSMRDLDNRGLITGDFLLVSGDVVTNIDFCKAMTAHKQRKLVDKDHIATMVLTKASPLHRARSPVDPSVFILDEKTSRCIYFQNIPSIDGKKSTISIDPELLEDLDDGFSVRNDLIDCHVDICLPHVPQIFQENFDYQYLRQDFVKGVLTSDLLKKTIYAYIVDNDEYATRVESWATYGAISQDILARWCYPLVPDSNLLDGQTFSYEFNNIYKEEKVVLAQSCKIGTSTSIGANTVVGDGSIIKKSVIGKNCQVGKNVEIYNSYVWDGVVIGENCTIRHSIIATNARVLSGAAINPGAVIGFNVVIGANKTISNNLRIVESPIEVQDGSFGSTSSFEEDEANNEPKQSTKLVFSVKDVDLVGEDGVGFVYNSERDHDDSDSDFGGSSSVSSSKPYSGIIYQMSSLNLSDDSIASYTTHKVNRLKRRAQRNRRFSSTSMVSTDFEGGYSEVEDEEDFGKEAIATVERAMENNHDIDTALLELNTLRMSYNVTYHEVRLATVQALLSRVVHFISTDTLDVKEASEKIFRSWGQLFRRQVFDDDEQVDLAQILQVESVVLNIEYNTKILFYALNILYDEDILDEDNIYTWYESPASNATPELVAVKALAGKWVEWLKDAEEESDDE